ncbi:hypothetical protein M1E08_02885 [Erwinia sp. PK3-005]|uniref:Uncharacterized protein n=1 Tax=Mixta hanseatica TaxID=2872648 RepID=A0ABY4R6B7_9GAMM|nr:hypothetical protein [Mixta hanseatica]UQY43634.1 hypothetical protein K6958_17485 [Mixta hanseatica]
MRELIQPEILAVSGSGFISQIGGLVGDFVGDTVYSFVPALTIKIPFLGDFDIRKSFPKLGSDIGKGIGEQIGNGIEFIGSMIPIFGGLINKIMGN